MTSSDYFVRIIALPPAVRGVTVPNDDGTFSIYINSLYSEGVRRRVLQHELEHLARDHFYKDEPIARQEAEADAAPPPAEDDAPAPAPLIPEGGIRCYHSLRTLTEWLRSIDALGPAVEDLAGEDRE